MGASGCAVTPTLDPQTFAFKSAKNSFEVSHRKVDAPKTLVLDIALDRQSTGPSSGAHALASVISYWKGPHAISGDLLFREAPPAKLSAGYRIDELIGMSRDRGVTSRATRLGRDETIAELQRGRPVLAAVRLPGLYLSPQTIPGADVPVIGFLRNVTLDGLARLSELTSAGMRNHYLVIAGYDDSTQKFIVVDPVQGYRTISYQRLERYREPFGDAAIVFTAPRAPPSAIAIR
jgi:hypothetical protein